MAEHDHALFLQESFDGKVARHVREALGSEAASYLDAPPDVELRDNGLVEVVSRRGYVKQRLLEDHLTATLACCFELESYARHLRMAPHACASLLASGTTGESLLPTQTNLLEAVKAEWSLVVRMEGKVATADLLHQLCPYVLHQCYRELMSSLAAADFCLTAECREMVSAWYPGLSQSSNVEDVFKSCEEACRRTKAGAASMPNLSIVAMRALMQKMTNGEGQARSVVLEGSDFEGPEVKALKSKLFSPESFTGGLLERKEMSLDDLLKDNTGTTAFNHNKLHLNNMQGLLLADKMGIDVEVAARSFWVPPLCQRGMLFSLEKGGKYFLSVGSTPAVCHASCLQDALPLQELDLQFCGELPPETLNEQEVPTSSREQQDPLQTNEFVRALKVEVNEKPLQLLLTKFWQAAWKKVRVFNYSVHLSPDGYLLRRCQNDLPLVAALMKSGGILSLTSDALSRVLDEAGSSLRKSATKTQKIRAVCSLAVVKQHVKQSRIDEILEHCQQLDDKRLQKIDAAAADAEDDEEEQPDDEAQDPLEPQDPAWAAAAELLRGMEQEEQKHSNLFDASDGAQAEDAQRQNTDGQNREKAEKGRSMLVSTAAIPAFLVSKYGLLEKDKVVFVHAVTKDQVLPHFQARLLGGKTFEGKGSCAASYNPDLREDLVDENRSSGSAIAPKKRSQAQAFFICFSWAQRALKMKKPKQS
ncbi:hemA [Symbiodinium sp. CCMP2592]|nr:hemA [Symbiodinium sp. CCMP2592]